MYDSYMFNKHFIMGIHSIYDIQEIRKRREKLKISQEKMAEILKVTPLTYLKYEQKGDMLFTQALKCTQYLQALEEVENKIK